MPIYAYRCTDCGLQKDHLQKLSDPLISECPSCGSTQYQKALTAAGFQLKGSGWYATDFKGGNTSTTTVNTPSSSTSESSASSGAACNPGCACH